MQIKTDSVGRISAESVFVVAEKKPSRLKAAVMVMYFMNIDLCEKKAGYIGSFFPQLRQKA